MQQHLTRWLPAIAKTSYRRTVLSLAGVAVLGALAVGPATYAGREAGTPHPDAVAAIALATGQTGTTKNTSSANGVQADPVTSTRPDPERLVPHGVQGVQSRIPLDDAQLANAREIVETARDTGVGERGAVIGVATALQESKLYNLGHLGAYNDHDSQGLFQQRPSSGWGTPDQITDPEYASTAFFEALKRVDGWQQAPLTVAAQTVQVSAYPFAYAQWEEQAAEIVQQVW